MSELLDSYTSQMPAKCLKCPVFRALLDVTESYEENAHQITDAMVNAPGDGPFGVIEADHLWRNVHVELLSMSTEGELQHTHNIARLAEYGSQCPTPKRGSAPGEVLTSSIVSWITNNKVCRNPGLKDII